MYSSAFKFSNDLTVVVAFCSFQARIVFVGGIKCTELVSNIRIVFELILRKLA